MQNSELRPVVELHVRNTGSRPVHISSRFHFFNANDSLEFDRQKSFGYHLNIPAASSMCFEPGDEIEIELIAYDENWKPVSFCDLNPDYSGQEHFPAYYPKRFEAFLNMH